MKSDTDDTEPIRVPIGDVLDLHTFRPRELAPLIEDYIEACLHTGFRSVRIVHGKGKGVQKQRVHELLRRHPQVISFHDAPLEAGGWGATIVSLTAAPLLKSS